MSESSRDEVREEASLRVPRLEPQPHLPALFSGLVLLSPCFLEPPFSNPSSGSNGHTQGNVGEWEHTHTQTCVLNHGTPGSSLL